MVHREHPVLVASEIRELIHVFPYTLVRRMEQVRTVTVHLDPRFRFLLRVGVAAQVMSPFDHQHPLVQLGGRTLGHGKAEETGTDNDEVIFHEAHVAGG